MEMDNRESSVAQSPAEPGLRARQNPIFAALLICEAFLAFGLGVFGNKVADLLDISATWIILGTAATMLLLYLVTLARLRYEAGVNVLPQSYSFLGTATTVFPVGVASGLVISILDMTLLPGRSDYLLHTILHDYELVTFLIGILIFFLMGRRAKRKLLISLYALGYGIGAAATVELLDSENNNMILTLVGTIVSITVGSLLVSSSLVLGIVSRFEQDVFGDSTKP